MVKGRARARDGEAAGASDKSEDAPYRVRIAEMTPSERPRERLAEHGSEYLSDAELLAIILRTGTTSGSAIDLARELLARFKGLAGLAEADLQALQETFGIGAAKAAELKAACEIGRRLLLAKAGERPKIGSAADAEAYIGPSMRHLEQETLMVLLLDTRHRVIEAQTIATGALNVVSARMGDVFRAAVRRNCAAVILAHNHPSGDAQPSNDDLRLTKAAVDAGKVLGVEVLDHLVIGRWGDGYTSIREAGGVW